MLHKLFYLNIFSIFLLHTVADSKSYEETHGAVRSLFDTVFNTGEHGVKTVHRAVDELWDDFDPIQGISKVISVSEDLDQAISNISASLDKILTHILYSKEGKEHQGGKGEHSNAKNQSPEKNNDKGEHTHHSRGHPEGKSKDPDSTKPPTTDAPKTRRRRDADDRNLSGLIETVVSQVLSNGGQSHGKLTSHSSGHHHPGTDTDLSGLIETIVSQLLPNGDSSHGQHSHSSKQHNQGNPQTGLSDLLRTVVSQLTSNRGQPLDNLRPPLDNLRPPLDNLRPQAIGQPNPEAIQIPQEAKHDLEHIIRELLKVFEEIKHNVHDPNVKMYINLILSVGRTLLANIRAL